MTFRNTHRLAVIGFVVALLVVQIFSANAASVKVLNSSGNRVTIPLKIEETSTQDYIKFLYNNHESVVTEKNDKVVIKFTKPVILGNGEVKSIHLTKGEFEALNLEEK